MRYFLSLLLFFAACIQKPFALFSVFGSGYGSSVSIIQKSAPITVSVKSEKQSFSANDSILMDVCVVNTSKGFVLLPASLDMGYESSINRNFFFQVKDSLGNILSGKDEISDYNRIYTLPSSQRKKAMQPGEKIFSKVNLNEWYHFKAGTYLVRMAFDPQNEETDLPENTFPVYSEWIKIEIAI